MTKLFAYLVIAISICGSVLTKSCVEQNCPIIESGVTEFELMLLPIPNDCTKFIMCQRGAKHIMYNLHFININDIVNLQITYFIGPVQQDYILTIT